MMRRQENQPPRPTAGCLPVPLFNQKKRNRVPLTSAPSESEFFSHCEFMTNTSPASSHISSASGTYGSYQATGPSSSTPQRLHWNRQGIPQSTPPQQSGGNRAAPGPAPTLRSYAPIPHPYKGGGTSSKPSNPVRQQLSIPSVKSPNSQYQDPHINKSGQSKPSPQIAFSQRSLQSFNRPPHPTHQYSQQSRPPPAPTPLPSIPPAHDPPPQNSWKFTNSFGPQSPPFDGKRSANRAQIVLQNQTQTQQGTFPVKPAVETTLRIMTAVIDGMRHWSQFKDKVPYLFEIFATLDSAVTLGRHGAKSFLMRDGKQAVQCVFYENEKELPRLIRGQVHRCVGNYDRSRDVLNCVSIRPGLPSEVRNAQEAVKACDAEMRALVKSLSEV